MTEPSVIAAILATFLLAGGVKGVIGLGLPTVSLGLMTAVLDLPSAMALMIVPSFVTNLWQGVVGGHLGPLLRRLWPFLLAATVTIFFGALVLNRVELSWLSALLGLLLVAYALLALSGIKLSIRPERELAAASAFGSVNGVLTGMTGSFVVPGVLYLQAIGLPRDQLVQAMGILFTLSTVALAIALGSAQLWTAELGVASMAAVVPAILGMVIGARIRARLSEALFRRVFFLAILTLGLYISARAAFTF